MSVSDGETATARRIGVGEFRDNMAEVLRKAHGGDTFLITSQDEIVAELRPPSRAVRPRRQPGALRGRIRVADDFDVLPPEVIAAMEG